MQTLAIPKSTSRMYVNGEPLAFALEPIVLFYGITCLEDPHLTVLEVLDLFEWMYSPIPSNAYDQN